MANPEKDSYEANLMSKDDIDRYGPGQFEDFVDFEEFDGGDGQMGVAGDGDSKLEKIGEDSQDTVVQTGLQKVVGSTKSRDRSARNAWGTSTGYADKLRDEGVETSRAQQLENWANQQSVLKQRRAQRYQTEEFDALTGTEMEDEDWRTLKNFGVDRNEDFDFDDTFGPVQPGDVEESFTLSAVQGGICTQTIPLANKFMGFSDFRAA